MTTQTQTFSLYIGKNEDGRDAWMLGDAANEIFAMVEYMDELPENPYVAFDANGEADYFQTLDNALECAMRMAHNYVANN